MLFEKTAPCLSFTEIIATMIAKNLLEKTQNAAEGNLPSGDDSVGLNSVVMISSCIYPHVRYEIKSPVNANANFPAWRKNSGLSEIAAEIA